MTKKSPKKPAVSAHSSKKSAGVPPASRVVKKGSEQRLGLQKPLVQAAKLTLSEMEKGLIKQSSKKLPKASSGSKSVPAGLEFGTTPLAKTGKDGLPKSESRLAKGLAKKPSGSLESPIRIFQIYYEGWQRELLDPHFIALDNSKSTSEMLEFNVFERLAKSEYIKGAELWGALSWRFTEKTGMSGADWMKAIESQPNQDVYYCNPYPENEALFHNMWLHGETRHPQFLALSQAVFQVAGLPEEELYAVSVSDQFATTNSIVATPKFWNAYLPWVAQIMSLANKKLPPKVRDLLHSKNADQADLHKGASYVPFIVERLFPVFLKESGKAFKSFKVPLPERERELNVHLKLLREMKDVAHKTKSIWLAACWVNYRNLYLTQVNGKEWCSKHLRNITPTEIKFT